MAERIPDAPAPEGEALSQFCHTVGLMLHKPISLGRPPITTEYGMIFMDADELDGTAVPSHDPGDLDALHAARARAYELWNPRGAAPTQAEVDEMVEMIPVRYREMVVESAVRLRAAADRFERENAARPRLAEKRGGRHLAG